MRRLSFFTLVLAFWLAASVTGAVTVFFHWEG